jgi:predicted double-glycine peptidase
MPWGAFGKDDIMTFSAACQTATGFAKAWALLLPLLFISCSAVPGLRTPQSFIEQRRAGMEVQKHEFTCGAASLATVMTLLETPTSESGVLKALFGDQPPYRINERGEIEIPALSAEEIEKAARRLGFKIVTLRAIEGAEAEKALGQLRPVICRLQLYSAIPHFVVLIGIENGWVRIADPGYGNIRIPLRQFYDVWNKGERIMIAVSGKPFLAWKDEAGTIHLKRDPTEELGDPGEIAPTSLYAAALAAIRTVNTSDLLGR